MVGIDFDGPVENILLASMMVSEAAYIETPEIKAGFTFNDPLRHHLPCSSTCRDPMSTKAGCHEKIPHLGCLSHDEITIGSKGLGSIEHGDNLGFPKDRLPFHSKEGKGVKMFIIRFQ